jgi:hypothetical protein
VFSGGRKTTVKLGDEKRFESLALVGLRRIVVPAYAQVRVCMSLSLKTGSYLSDMISRQSKVPGGTLSTKFDATGTTCLTFHTLAAPVSVTVPGKLADVFGAFVRKLQACNSRSRTLDVIAGLTISAGKSKHAGLAVEPKMARRVSAGMAALDKDMPSDAAARTEAYLATLPNDTDAILQNVFDGLVAGMATSRYSNAPDDPNLDEEDLGVDTSEATPARKEPGLGSTGGKAGGPGAGMARQPIPPPDAPVTRPSTK